MTPILILDSLLFEYEEKKEKKRTLFKSKKWIRGLTGEKVDDVIDLMLEIDDVIDIDMRSEVISIFWNSRGAGSF